MFITAKVNPIFEELFIFRLRLTLNLGNNTTLLCWIESVLDLKTERNESKLHNKIKQMSQIGYLPLESYVARSELGSFKILMN